MKSMTIGEVARRSGTGIETIRYYEREGLLSEPVRRPSGYRQYDETAVARLDYIRRAKELGFALSEIRELLELSSISHSSCDHIYRQAVAKIADIESKIRSLQQMKWSLRKLVERCRGKASSDDCPLVHKSKKPTKK